MDSGKLVVLSAPSGSGKTSLVKELLKEKLNLAFSVSATSRAPRRKEKNNLDYYFLSHDEFVEKINGNAFLEYEEVYEGTFYGTLKSEIKRIWESGKHVLFDIDVYGGIKIKNQYPKNTLSIFVMPPSIKELEIRLRKRGTESEEKIKYRLNKSAEELSLSKKFDVVIINDDFIVTKNKLIGIVNEFIKS